MPGPLPHATAAEVRRKLARDGWYVSREGASHSIFRHPTKRGRVEVSRHMTEIIKPKTMRSILQQAGLTVEDFQRL
ncbi:MAG TPA: type II toxin-antitoxin system HicA family toxin [Chloroflexota bacterium]|jgi:predicted RNA binding protein YcfA (HicA-like mRNA interferase family)